MSKTCYNTGVQTVGLVRSSVEILSSLWSDEPQAIIIFVDDHVKTTTTPGPGTQENQYKLQNFVFLAPSMRRLKRTLIGLKASPWWNHMASFLVIDESSSLGQGCSNAFKMLTEAWRMDLFHVKLVCHHKRRGTLIYSYNPYINQAPHPWQVVKTYRRKNKHPWTLLVRSYHDGQEICKDLDFDKAKDLGGYETRLSLVSVRSDKLRFNINFETINSFNAIFLRYIFRALNSSVKILVESPKSIFNLTSTGRADMSIDSWYLEHNFNASMTYPHASSGLISMTQHRGQLSQIDKLLHVLDESSRYAVVLVGFVTFLCFKFFLRQSVTSAILNIVRLICNTGIVNIPNNATSRIFLSGLFIFSVTLQGIYQGLLASLLTKQVNLPNIDTLEDLHNFNYTIYGNKDFTSYLEKVNFRGRFVSLDGFHCEKYVLEDAGAACVWRRSFLTDIAKKYDLHLSNDYLMQSFGVYLIRKDWPAEEKINTLISRLVEANIFDRVARERIEEERKRNKYNEKEKEKQKFEVMRLKDLAFAFAILGIGLACSSVVFIIENLIRWTCCVRKIEK